MDGEKIESHRLRSPASPFSSFGSLYRPRMDAQRINRESGGLEPVWLHVCDNEDHKTFNRFQDVLRRLDAKLKSEELWTPLGDIYEFTCGDEIFVVVSDSWTTEVMASAELIARFQDAMKEKQNPTT